MENKLNWIELKSNVDLGMSRVAQIQYNMHVVELFWKQDGSRTKRLAS